MFVACAAATLAACSMIPSKGGPSAPGAQSPGAAYARQILGGDLDDQRLARYVQAVGERLVRKSGLDDPDRFSIVDQSFAGSWTLPDGGVAVSRGLLGRLSCEADLAMVLATGIARGAVHEASHDGARSDDESIALPSRAQERLRSAIAANPYAPLVAGRATRVALSMARQIDSPMEQPVRDAAARYMTLAGYGGSGTKARCGRYERATANLRARSGAYDAYDAGVQALMRGDTEGAQRSAVRALALAPERARFYELLGDVAQRRGRPRAAFAYYQRAVQLDTSYFKPYLESGLALARLGDDTAAAGLLDHSLRLLPTASAAFQLGRISQESGDVQQAVHYYHLAASSDTAIGHRAARALVRIDLERNPDRYVHVQPRIDSAGNVWMVVVNHAPITIDTVVVAAALTRFSGDVAEGPVRLSTGEMALAPEAEAQLPTSLGPLRNPRAIRLVRAHVQAASAAR